MAMDLEAPNPAPPAPDPAPAAPAAPAEPAAPVAPSDPDEATAVEVQGGKYVPLAALKQLRDENKSLKEKAGKADQYEQYLINKAPLIKVLEENPGIFQQATRPAAPAPAPEADPELVELARSLDYYKADGSPDLDRAAKFNAIMERKAERKAQQMVAPIAQTTAEQRANANYTHFAAQKLPNGQTIDPNTLAKYWRSLPAQYTADPRIAAVAFNLAAMEQMSSSPLPPAPAAPAAPPLVTESLSTPVRAAKLSDVERAVAASRGIPEEKMAKLTSGFTPGRTSSLED